MRPSELSTRLSEYDPKTCDCLPTALLDFIVQHPKGYVIHKNGSSSRYLSMQELPIVDSRLHDKLRAQGMNDESLVPTLLFGSRKIYYHPITGQRLGDELGMNDWLRTPTS